MNGEITFRETADTTRRAVPACQVGHTGGGSSVVRFHNSLDSLPTAF
jgi:hypothetical protein